MATGKDKDKGNDKDIELNIVVNGTPVKMEAKLNQPLEAILVAALKKGGVAGDPEPDRWVFKDANGNVLDKHQKISDFNFSEGATLFLSMEAGVAG